VAVLVLPELSLTGYTCGDLFQQTALQRAAVQALDDLVQKSVKVYRGLTIVGLPLVVDDKLYNCAAAFQQGRLLGAVPKSFLPNYKEFYENPLVLPREFRRATRRCPSRFRMSLSAPTSF